VSLRLFGSWFARLFRPKREPVKNHCPAAYAVRGKNYRLVHCVLEHRHEPPCEDEYGSWRKDLPS